MLYGRNYTTWCHIPHNCSLHNHVHANLKHHSNCAYIFYFCGLGYRSWYSNLLQLGRAEDHTPVNACFTDFITVILHLQHVKWDNTGGCPWSPITQTLKIYLSPFFHTEHCLPCAEDFVLTILSKKLPFYLGWHSIPNARVYTSHMALQKCHPLVAFLSDYLGD